MGTHKKRHLGKLFKGMTPGVDLEEKMGREAPGKKEQVDLQAEDIESARAQRCSMERYYGYCRWLGYLEAQSKM